MWKMSTVTPNEDARIGNHPDLFHPPAYPAVLAAGFKLFDAFGLDPSTKGQLRNKDRMTRDISIRCRKFG